MSLRGRADRLSRRPPPDLRRRWPSTCSSTIRFWLIAIEVVFVVVAGRRAAAVARDVPASRPRRGGPAADPRRGVHVALPAGRPAGDRRADRRLQPDGRSPARRAGAARRAAPVPQPGARRSRPRASSSSTSTARSAASTRRPSACSTATAAAAVGRRLEALGLAARRRARGARVPAMPRLVGMLGARRVKCHHGTFLDRGFPRSFLLVEELTEELRQFERAAYEKLIRVMSHEVNNTVAASNSLLHSSLDLRRRARRRATGVDFEQAIGIVIERTEQLNSFMRRFADVFRLPPPLTQPCDLVADPRGHRRGCSRADADAARRRAGAGSSTQPAIVRSTIDRGQIEQALLNILKNAVEAIDGDGTVTIRRDGGGRTHDADHRRHRAGHQRRSAGQPVHAVLQHQAARPGHRPDAGPGDSQRARLRLRLERTPQGTTRFTVVRWQTNPRASKLQAPTTPNSRHPKANSSTPKSQRRPSFDAHSENRKLAVGLQGFGRFGIWDLAVPFWDLGSWEWLGFGAWSLGFVIALARGAPAAGPGTAVPRESRSDL